jgi:hypothetical protein
MALAVADAAPDVVLRALDWLSRLQRRDGAVPVSTGIDAPHWPTALALLAWLRCGPQTGGAHAAEIEAATEWLISARGLEVPRDSGLHDHDTTLVGWPWVSGSHSWLEPTAYAVLALRAAGRADHPRVREGSRLILDRALPGGGWNYGNRQVLEHVLRPFPATTGVALAAVSGARRDGRVNAALAYLRDELEFVRAPLSLAWGVIGMRAWDVTPLEGAHWLTACAERLAKRPCQPHYDAMLLLAGAAVCPLVESAGVSAHG